MNRRTADDGARLTALRLLEGVLDGKLNLAEAESRLPRATGRDRAFARHLAYGVLRWLSALEWLAQQLLKRPFKARDRDIQRLILIGLFELWKDGSAPHAAINETAEGARSLGKPWAVGVINAVLRRFQRERHRWLDGLTGNEARFAHPQWLLGALKADWPDCWRDIVDANNRAAPLWLRLNCNHPAADTEARLERQGFSLERHPLLAEARKISPAAAVDDLDGFEEGRYSVQDPAAQLAAHLLDARGNARVLDACAAPGGKTCHILERAPGVRLTALDRSAQRLERVHENIQRLGLNNGKDLRLLAADAAEPDSWWDGQRFDRILLDAPCSATGVIRRHPEIKWLRTVQQVHEAAAVQARLLRRLWPLLEPGGMLLYATCSVLREENSTRIRSFAKHCEDAVIREIDAGWGQAADPGRQILPGELEMDGFFYATLRKPPGNR